MPRPQGSKNKNQLPYRFQVCIPSELKREIDRAAEAAKITPSKAARRFLVAGLAAEGIFIDPSAAKIA